MKWSQCFSSLADPSIAPPRFGHSAVCVANTNWGSDLVVVYGGVGAASGDSAQTALGDVIVLQVDNGTWSAPDILPGSSPGARAFHSAVAIGSRVLLFGGHILTFESAQNRKRRAFFNDVWQLDTDEWQWSKLNTDASAAHPPGRDMAAWLLLDDSRLLLFGGRSETGKSLQDVWLFDLTERTWQQLRPDGALPPPRKMHSMVKLGSQVLLFGGERDSGPLDDLWVLRGWQPGATPRWTQIKMKASPSPRFGHSLAVGPVATPTTAAVADASSKKSTGGADKSSTGGAAATPSVETTGPAATGTPKSSSGGDGAAAFGQERVVLFGGCLDLSSFLSLNRNYVQSKEAWLLDMNQLTWVQASSVDASGVGPAERMCHSMTTLSDGRMLLLGGRHKEGICRDIWWLEMTSDALTPPSPSAAAAAANTSTGGSQQQASGASTPTRPASQSLLQSLLAPMRPRDTAQGQQQPALAATADSIASRTAETPLPLRQQQQQDLLQLDDFPVPTSAEVMPAATSAATAAVNNTNNTSYSLPAQQQQLVPQLSHTPGITALPPHAAAAPQPPAAPAAPATVIPPSYATGAQQVPQQPLALSNYYVGYGSGSSSSTGQPFAALMDSSGELARLIRNPADAINKLSSSVSSTVNSLQQQLPGALAGALPAALQRVAPNLLSPSLQTGTSSSASGVSSSSSTRQAHPAFAALRAQLGLPPAGQQQHQQVAAAAAGPCMAPGVVLQGLATLGQQLLGDDSAGPNDTSSAQGAAAASSGPGRAASGSSFTSSSSLPPDVLVAAARQHLMSTAVVHLHVAQIALLLADYQHLAAACYEQQMCASLAEGFSAAANTATSCASTFLQRQPHEVLLNQVEQLQAEYKKLITDAPA